MFPVGVQTLWTAFLRIYPALIIERVHPLREMSTEQRSDEVHIRDAVFPVVNTIDNVSVCVHLIPDGSEVSRHESSPVKSDVLPLSNMADYVKWFDILELC